MLLSLSKASASLPSALQCHLTAEYPNEADASGIWWMNTANRRARRQFDSAKNKSIFHSDLALCGHRASSLATILPWLLSIKLQSPNAKSPSHPKPSHNSKSISIILPSFIYQKIKRWEIHQRVATELACNRMLLQLRTHVVARTAVRNQRYTSGPILCTSFCVTSIALFYLPCTWRTFR